MRIWIVATLVVGALAILFAWRDTSVSSRLRSLQQERDELAAQQQELIGRMERLEERWSAQTGEKLPAATAYIPADTTQLNRRVTALEQQLRQLRLSLPAEYDPTVAAEPEPVTNAVPKRNWGPEQATGAPDTEREGDVVTAWTALQPDGGPEWLAVGFDRAVEIAQVRIRESYNPGAITKVTASVNGAEVVLWEGTSAGGRAPRDFVVSLTGGMTTSSIIIYQDTSRVNGWNEIDAVELVGCDGSRQWANSASASSTYADRATANARVEWGSLQITPTK